MSKKLSTKERALLATADSASVPSPSAAPVAVVVVESVDDAVARYPQRPRTGLGISSAQFFRNDEVTAENDRLRSELKIWDGAHATKKLDPNLIKASKWANRHESSFKGPEFEALKKEIESAGGNVQPIKVRPIHRSEPQCYEVVFGHRRHRACLELGISVLTTIESIDDKELFKEMDRENRQRADLRPYEQGVMYKRALDEGLFVSQRKLAEELGVEQSNVSVAVKIASFPESVLRAFSSPLDIQFRWATPLGTALDKDPDVVLALAKAIAHQRESGDAISPGDVYKRLAGLEKVRDSVSSRVVKIDGGKSFTVKEDGDQISFAFDKLEKAKRSQLEKLIEDFLKD